MSTPNALLTPGTSVTGDSEFDDIAVIGLACRFPGGANDAEKFWELLCNKRSAFCKAPQTRYNVDAFHNSSRNKLNTLSALGGHFLEEDVAAFDAPFFNITAEEAKAMDPTARMLLEVTYEAMENAGLPITNLTGSDTSCYVGCFTRDYHEMLMRDAEMSPMYAGTGTGFSLLSNRVSWFYDLRGLSMTLDTACSSSLVGMHLACQGLRSKESKIAVVCGANLILSPDLGMWLSNLKMTSVDGLSRSFADGVTGYGRGEGIATVILKPLTDALKDGDAIRAVIRGTGVNQDGHTTGITLPNSEAQADLIRATYRAAGLDFLQTSYFEAHGTGTEAGDPLELGAVARTISQTRKSEYKLYVGSVKSNIGHLEGAAGLAGVIKCILMLEKGSILPNIHFDRPSKRIPFDSWNIQVPTDVLPWPQNRLKRASVNSFGYGGTNAHTILDDAEQFLSGYKSYQDWQLVEKQVGSDDRERLFVFSAPDESALRRAIQRFGNYLSMKTSDAGLQNALDRNTFFDRLSFTLSNRRTRFSWKASATATTIAELQEALSTSNSTLIKRTPDSARLAFVFTGQGAQWAKMGMGLMSYPVFSNSVHEADNYLRTHLGSEWSVITELQREKDDSNVHLAKISQPVCTVLQIALVELLKSWNIQPSGVVGHSSGEIAAAYCYGALSREDAWSVAYWRGKICSELQNDAPHLKGAMMAVGLSSEAAGEYISKVETGKIVVACINSPSSVTISGDESGIDELQKLLSADSVFCRKLVVENAYHSHHMEFIAEKYLQKISTIAILEGTAKNNEVKMASSVTGELITSSAELGPSYWVKNFVSPVRFSEAVALLLKDTNARRRRRARAGESTFDLLLEVGPHGALKGPLRQILRHHDISTVTYASILNRGEEATKSALHATGELYIHGVPVSISAVNIQEAQTPPPTPLVDLPTYAWNHSLRYWAESRLSKNYRFRKYPRHDLLGAPVADANDKEPRWRNILRASEQPWVRDHVVYSSILYPGSGMIVMVLEAIQQLVQERQGKIIESIKLENVRIGKAIVIPDDHTGVETLLQLRRQEGERNNASAEAWDFTVSSCHEESKPEGNSSGTVTVRYNSNSQDRAISQNTGKSLISQVARQEYDIAKSTCSQNIKSVDFYDATQAAGLKYGPAFQGLTEITAGSDRCVCTLKVPDWRKYNHVEGSPHLIHPTTLDIIFHSMFAAMVEKSNNSEGKLDFKTAAVPIAFDSLIFYTDNFPPSSSASPDQSAEFSTCCRVSRDANQRDLVADIYVSDPAWQEPKIVVQGIRCRELPGRDAGSSKGQVKAPLGTLNWKPDIDFVSEGSLRRYIDESLLSSSEDALPNGIEKDSAVELWEKEVSAIASLAAHKNPYLSILQVGRSDSLTRSLISALSAHDLSNPSLANYTIIDGDSEAIAQSQAIFQQSSDLITFYAGDIESGRESGNLKDDTFDLVIAVNDLDSADEIDHVMKCLHDRGRLLNGLNLEKASGFNSINHVKSLPDTSILNSFSDANRYVARKLSPTFSSEDNTIFVVEPRDRTPEMLEVSHQLSTKLTNQSLQVKTVQWSSAENTSGLHGKSLIFLLELETPFLSNLSEEDYTILKTTALNSSRLLWVSRGTDPAMQAPIGYLRTLQNENVNLDIRYLLLEEERANRSADDIASRLAELALSPTTDREYMEIDGSLCINRWVVDNRLKHVMNSDGELQSDSLELAALRDISNLTLKLHHILDKERNSVWFTVDEESQQSDLSADEVEVHVKAMGLNHGDTTAPITSIKEFSGIITKCGNSCSRLKEGDRVWTCALIDSYKTSFRVKESLCQVIPDSVSFEDAASWAVTHSTAYQAVIQMAKIQPGQRILIQSAANAIGQIAIQIALRQGAQVYATVDSKEQSEVVQNINIPRENVLEDDDQDLAAAISHLTSGKGFDVIINQTSTGKSLQQLWNSVAAFGVLIDINSSETSFDEQHALALAPFHRGASYRVFNLVKILEDSPSQMANILHNVLQFSPYLQNVQKLIPWKVFSATSAAEAFEWTSTSHAHEAKAILTFSPGDNIFVDRRALNSLTLDPNYTYLLAGGLGGLGKSLAKLLAEKGARHLAFVSRSGPESKNAVSLTQELASMGVKSAIYAADVSDRTAMADMLVQCAADGMPPIHGVIQSAAVLEDSIYDNMTYKQWANATRPKIQGSWILHQLLSEANELQFFVMLSSIAGVVGNRSQANYSAGNTFQDALANYRRQRGLPAVSVDLGLMLGIGLIAEERGGTTNLKKWEAVGINEQEFHAIMTAAMAENRSLPAQVICGLPTGGILQSEDLDRPFYFDDPRFSFLRKKDVDETLNKQDGDGDDAAESPSSQLSRAESMRDAIDIITTAVCQRLARGLQTEAENIDANRPLHSYGVDSLMAVEIRTWITVSLQADISLFDILSGVSVAALAVKIAAKSKAVPDNLN